MISLKPIRTATNMMQATTTTAIVKAARHWSNSRDVASLPSSEVREEKVLEMVSPSESVSKLKLKMESLSKCVLLEGAGVDVEVVVCGFSSSSSDG